MPYPVKEFKSGQQVKCIYYHEYFNEPKAKNRSWLSLMFDKPFKPVKYGVVTGSAGVHPYWLAGGDGTEEYLWVKFKEYRFKKAIPISCCYDAKQAAIDDVNFLKQNYHNIGQKGYSKKAFIGLTSILENNPTYKKND